MQDTLSVQLVVDVDFDERDSAVDAVAVALREFIDFSTDRANVVGRHGRFVTTNGVVTWEVKGGSHAS